MNSIEYPRVNYTFIHEIDLLAILEKDLDRTIFHYIL